jgi:hypothetical protein
VHSAETCRKLCTAEFTAGAVALSPGCLTSQALLLQRLPTDVVPDMPSLHQD